jgi:hypothetical protein
VQVIGGVQNFFYPTPSRAPYQCSVRDKGSTDVRDSPTQQKPMRLQAAQPLPSQNIQLGEPTGPLCYPPEYFKFFDRKRLEAAP